MGRNEDASSTVELNLGLSVGPASPALTSRREYHAFRRRETRRKLEHKHMGKAQAPASGDITREDYGRSPPRFSASPIPVPHPNSGAAVGYAAAIPVVPMHCTPPALQYVPCGGRMYALPYMVPCWPEPAVDSDRRVACQVAAVGVPVVGNALASVSKSCSNVAEFLNITNKEKATGIYGRSNSSSCKDTKSESNLTNATIDDNPKPPQHSHAPPQQHLLSSEILSKNVISTVKLLPPKLQREESTTPTSMKKKGGDHGPEKREIVQKIPCVAARGDGPEGKTITGFLYRYTVEEVSIMCVCHGLSFSPTEFLRHAGNSETTQPLRHIKVVPTLAKS
ncbi:Ninja-family protein AFP3 [Platanthera guangdongensis]|uniref:Ninja-family protein n=1 Tax=Platanthera guangdongensis TaxID=2320717 RepID=A0ABR2LKD6_9ASPA